MSNRREYIDHYQWLLHGNWSYSWCMTHTFESEMTTTHPLIYRADRKKRWVSGYSAGFSARCFRSSSSVKSLYSFTRHWICIAMSKWKRCLLCRTHHRPYQNKHVAKWWHPRKRESPSFVYLQQTKIMWWYPLKYHGSTPSNTMVVPAQTPWCPKILFLNWEHLYLNELLNVIM